MKKCLLMFVALVVVLITALVLNNRYNQDLLKDVDVVENVVIVNKN